MASILSEFHLIVHGVSPVHDRLNIRFFAGRNRVLDWAAETLVPKIHRIAVAIINRDFREILGFHPVDDRVFVFLLHQDLVDLQDEVAAELAGDAVEIMMMAALGKKRKIINPAGWICGLGAKSIYKKERKAGNEPGLYLPKVMTDVMAKDMVIPQAKIDEVCAELHIGRGGLAESITAMMERAYPNHSFK